MLGWLARSLAGPAHLGGLIWAPARDKSAAGPAALNHRAASPQMCPVNDEKLEANGERQSVTLAAFRDAAGRSVRPSPGLGLAGSSARVPCLCVPANH